MLRTFLNVNNNPCRGTILHCAQCLFHTQDLAQAFHSNVIVLFRLLIICSDQRAPLKIYPLAPFIADLLVPALHRSFRWCWYRWCGCCVSHCQRPRAHARCCHRRWSLSWDATEKLNCATSKKCLVLRQALLTKRQSLKLLHLCRLYTTRQKLTSHGGKVRFWLQLRHSVFVSEKCIN